MGYPKEHQGISCVLDTTEHSNQQLQQMLIHSNSSPKGATNHDQASLVNLFAMHGLDANLFFLTSRPDDIEQKRHYFNMRSWVVGAIFDLKNEDMFVSMSASLGDQSLDMLNIVQKPNAQ